MSPTCGRGKPTATRDEGKRGLDAAGDHPGSAETGHARLCRPVANELEGVRAVVDNEVSSHEELAEEPNTMDMPVVWSRVVQSPQAADDGSGQEGGAGMATVVRRPVLVSQAEEPRVRRERALATVSMLVAVSGVYCEDRDSIITWKNLGTCCWRMTGSSPGLGSWPTLSQQGWWLRRWWTRINMAEARAAHDRFLVCTMGLEQRTPEGRLEAWRDLILSRRTEDTPRTQN